MLDRAFFDRYRVLPSPGVERAVAAGWSALERATSTHLQIENIEALPDKPVLLATNSTQKYDFMPLRVELRRRGIRAVTVTKGKNYHQPLMGWLLGRVGVVPIASRGYLLLVDFVQTAGRRPSEDEYRRMRAHLDDDEPLPPTPAFHALQSTRRELLGYPVDPGHESWSVALRRIYSEVMQQTLRLCREAVNAGCHVQMYPEGTVSSRLGQGRIGAVQLAWTLGLPLLPVGLSGMRDAFVGQGLRLRRGGAKVTARFGAAYALRKDFLPRDFRPFDPDHERRHRATLLDATAQLMDRLDLLLDADCRRAEGFVPDGTHGTRRFL